ncbi:MAG: hypothetical protein ABSA75_13435 [Candidatus Bathyarchaeia archaeon]|jgi:hypothetical protein
MKQFDFSVAAPKKTAKQTLQQIAVKMVKTFRPNGKIKFMGMSFDIINILVGELSKVDEQTAEKFLEELKRELETNP